MKPVPVLATVKGIIMLHKKWIAIAVLATATTAVSTAASADNRGINTALGAVVGAVIGNSMGGQNAAVVGGVLGAVVGASVSGHDNARYYGRPAQVRYREPVYYRPAPVHARPYYRDARRVDYHAPYGYRDNRDYRR
jgi:hypothetical protein